MAGSYNLGTAEGTIRIKYDGKGSAQARTDFAKTEGAAKKSGVTMNEVGTKALVAGGAIAAGFGFAAKKALDFEKEISAIGSVTGGSAKDLDLLRQKALQLGADTSFSASEAAGAMEELAKAGLNTTQILGGAADATVALAAAGGVDLATAATIASNAMNQFNLKASDLPKIADQIAGAANASAIGVGDLGQSLQQVGAVANLAGLSFQDTAVAIAELGNAGIRGSDAGTSLKTFLQNLIPTTKQQITLSKQLGLITKDGSNAFFDQSGKVKSLADVSQVLQNATKNMSKEQKLAAFQVLFGSDAIRAAAVLADGGAKGFNDLAAAMNKTTAADVAAKRLDNTAGRIEALKGSVETAAIAIGELLLPFVDQLAKFLTRLANGFSSLSNGQQKAILIIVAVAAGILILVGVIYKIIALVKVFQAVWLALNTSFIATPIGAIITAVVLLVVAIYLLWTRSSAFRNFFIGLWNGIWSVLKAIGHWFAGPFTNFFVGIWNAVFPVLKAIGKGFAALWNGIVAGVRFVWNIITTVFNFFLPLMTAVFGLVVAVFKVYFAIIGAVISVAVAIWKATIAPALNFIWQLIKAVIGFIVAVWTTGWGKLRAIITAVWGFIGPYVIIAIKTIQIIIGQVIGVISSIWSSGWNRMRSIISAVWGFITSFISGAVAKITAIINGIKNVVDKVRGFFNQLKGAASGGVGSLISFVAGIPGRVGSAIAGMASTLFRAGVNAIQSLINGFTSKAQAAYDKVKGIVDKIRNLLPFSPAKEGPLAGRGYPLYSGQALADSFAEGIQQHADNAVKATLQLVSQVNATASAASPLAQQFAYTGATPAPLFRPTVNAQPHITVVADLGDGMRAIVRHEIVDNPNVVSDSAKKGDDFRRFLAPGRPG